MFSKLFSRRSAVLLLLGTATIVAACGDREPTSPSRFTATIDAANWPDTIRVGEQRGFWARIVDISGRTVVDPPVTISTTTPDRLTITIGVQKDSAYVMGLTPGLAIVKAQLQTGVFNGTHATRDIPVVLSGVQLEHGLADTNLTGIGATLVARAAGVDFGGASVPSSGLTWSRKGEGAVSIVALAGSDSIKVTAVTAGEDTVTVTHSYCAGSCSQSFAVRVIVAEPAGLKLTTQPSAQAQAGVPFVQQPVVRLLDEDGEPVHKAGVAITASIGSGAGALAGTKTVETDAQGIATFTNLVIGGVIGNRTLKFEASDLSEAESDAIELAAGAAAVMTLHAGDEQIAERGTAVSTAPAVLVKDAYDNVVAGTEVAFEVLTGGGSLTGASPSSDLLGVAAAGSWTLGSTSGSQTVSASSNGLAGSPVVFTATAIATPTALAMVTQPSGTVSAGSAFAQQPAVRLVDAANEPVAKAGVTITAAIFSGGGVLLGTTQAQTDADGVATFTNLAIGGSTGTRVLRFTSSALTAVNSGDVAVTAGAASKVEVTGPTSVQVNNVSDLLTAQVLDAYDNATTVSAATVLALTSNTSGTATFFLSNGTTTTTTVTISAGSGSTTFRYRDTAAHPSRTVTATRTSGDAVGSAQHTLAVLAGSARFVGGSSNTTNNANNTNSLVVTRPAGLANGHVMIAMVTTGVTTSNDLPSINIPSGWTEVREDSRTGIRQRVFYRVVSNISTEAASYTFTISANARFSVGIAAYSGIKTSDPIAASGSITGTGSTITVSSQSAPTGGSTVVSLFGVVTGHDIVVAAPGEVRVTDGGNGGQRSSIAMADDDITGTSTGTRSASGVNTTPNIGQIIVLRRN